MNQLLIIVRHSLWRSRLSRLLLSSPSTWDGTRDSGQARAARAAARAHPHVDPLVPEAAVRPRRDRACGARVGAGLSRARVGARGWANGGTRACASGYAGGYGCMRVRVLEGCMIGV